ncbi:MAG TPA: pyridoxamine 5'-phosphate oxidase family protein [Acidimicrobiia bacterium]|nr:pyridoxamine 5'-phosphate oxidase family protein [Acidimicrobiia bacterium]
MADLDLVLRLVESDHGLAVVCTTRPDDTIQASVVNAGVMARPLDGRDAIAFVARGNAAKLANLRRRPYANIVFRAGWGWASVEGATTLIGPDDAAPGFDPADLPALLRAVFQSAGGTHDDWDAYDRTMADERRTAVLISTDRISSNG